MLQRGLSVRGGKVLVLGLTFKENCPDLRNTKVVDVIKHLRNFSADVDVFDPWIDRSEAKAEYALNCLASLPETGEYEAIILAVAHRQFIEMGGNRLRKLGQQDAVLYDVKSALPRGASDGRL
jgi:UDP-N-acetyl-D-galactosamine dehydrogenase